MLLDAMNLYDSLADSFVHSHLAPLPLVVAHRHGTLCKTSSIYVRMLCFYDTVCPCYIVQCSPELSACLVKKSRKSCKNIKAEAIFVSKPLY